MPTRDIKESCRTSFTLAQISHGAERCFWRLITYADDFGRFPAGSSLVRAQCFSAMLDQVTEADVVGWLTELADADLIRRYQGDGKDFAYFPTWPKHQRTRARFSKYPAPAGICQHLPACVGICRQLPADVAVVTEVPERTEKTVVSRLASASTLPASVSNMPASAGSGWQNGKPPDVEPQQVKNFLKEVKAKLAGQEPESPF